MGAIYMDAGFDAVAAVAARLFEARLEDVDSHARLDFKSRLQERAQALWQTAPVYEVVAEDGPDHDKRFEVALSLAGRPYGRAVGRSKKEAEQGAAAAALEAHRARGEGRRRERARCTRASPPTCWRSAAGCAAPGTRRTWSAAACATCCSGGAPADFDVATDAVPETVMELFGKKLRGARPVSSTARSRC